MHRQVALPPPFLFGHDILGRHTIVMLLLLYLYCITRLLITPTTHLCPFDCPELPPNCDSSFALSLSFTHCSDYKSTYTHMMIL